MQLRKVCNHPELFERRVPQAPYQFQAWAPPPHVPLPPAVLSGGGPVQPFDVTLLTRSSVQVVVPRALDDVSEILAYRRHFLVVRRGLWQPAFVRRTVSSGFSSALLSGGVSVGEVCDLMTTETFPIWSWLEQNKATDEKIMRFSDVYGASSIAVQDRTRIFNSSGESLSPSSPAGDSIIMSRPHWRLLQPRSQLLRQERRVILPGCESPAQLVVCNTRLLRSATVYVPAVSAPVPLLAIPGDPKEGAKLLAPESKLFFPMMPWQGSTRTTSEVYNTWRSLFGNYGAHIGSRPIIMPEAGRLVADSGKMTVLDRLLRRLKSEGHKCLIYSQFTKVLDILEDYCGKSAYKFCRLDGQSALADRRDIVADFQSNDELFIFLLSTRAGGVGLNLTAADTVIFFDSDWNPTQDLQAMDRAHRLGQERPVTVYRLTSRGTIEERMLIRAQQKSKINDLVIKGGGVQTEGDAEPTEAEVDDIAQLVILEVEESGIDMSRATQAARLAAERVDGPLAVAASIYSKRIDAPQRPCGAHRMDWTMFNY
jgi:SNF2 family DNA or RNA helicase